jgi:hypothetical protein
MITNTAENGFPRFALQKPSQPQESALLASPADFGSRPRLESRPETTGWVAHGIWTARGSGRTDVPAQKERARGTGTLKLERYRLPAYGRSGSGVVAAIAPIRTAESDPTLCAGIKVGLPCVFGAEHA